MDMTTCSTRVLRLKDLIDKIGLQRSSIYVLLARGDLPAGFRLVPGGKARGWLEVDIDRWLAARSENGMVR
jgi:prophage regulatory protein